MNRMKAPAYILALFIHLFLDLSMARIRTLSGFRGQYCASSVFRQTTARSALRCAALCSSDGQCVAYSQRGDQCLLHDDFCSSSELLSEQGALYTEVKWECFGSSCYYMPTLKIPLTKAKADAVCEAMGAHVLATETKEEDDTIYHLVFEEGYYDQAIWIDLINDVTWKHSGQLATYTNWAQNEPYIHPTKENCAMALNAHKWEDVKCFRQQAFLCEK